MGRIGIFRECLTESDGSHVQEAEEEILPIHLALYLSSPMEGRITKQMNRPVEKNNNQAVTNKQKQTNKTEHNET